MREKGFAPIIILLVLVGVALLAYFGYFYKPSVQPPPQPAPQETTSPIPSTTSLETPDPTANWKTYTSSTYSVKYPADFNSQEDEGSVLVISKWGPTQRSETEAYDGIFLRFIPTEIGTNLDDYVNAKIEDLKQQGIVEVLSAPKDVVINGYKGLTYTTLALGTNHHTILASGKGNMFIEIINNTADPGNLGFSQTVNQILSTFKFIQ